MKRWHTREDSGIRLDRQGRWWHDDERIDHPKIVEAFNVGLSVAEDGRYRLDFGNDWCFVEVEDAAFRVYAVTFATAEGELPLLDLSDRTREPLEPLSLSLDEEGVFLCRVKAGRALARFTREAQAALGELLVSEGASVALRLGTVHLPLPGLTLTG